MFEPNPRTEFWERTVRLLTSEGYKRVYTPDELAVKTFLVHPVAGGDTQVHWEDYPFTFTEQFGATGKLQWVEVYHVLSEEHNKFYSQGLGFKHTAQQLKDWHEKIS